MAVVTTKKHGYRELSGLDSDHFAQTVNAEGHTVWTATDNAGLVGVGWGRDDAQTHGTNPQDPTQPPLKAGSTVEEWTDEHGITRLIVRRVK